MTPNQKAFLTMLAVSEGTAGHGDDGYNEIVGGTFFTDYADHPRVKVWIERLQKYSTAAGRYQLLEEYFDDYRVSIPVPDFEPDSQDTIALQQIRERGALPDIEAGNLAAAIAKCANIWASLPGNTDGQGTNSLETLQTAYLNAGGTLADAPDTEVSA